MKRNQIGYRVLFGVIFFWSFWPSVSYPATTSSTVPQERTSATEGLDIFLLMDSSGSMKKTDPQNYRKAAAKLFLSLLSQEERVGIISFGESAQLLVPLTPNTEKNREKLLKGINQIGSHELLTNLYEAIRRGLAELKPSPRNNRLLLLLSDGKLDLGSKEKEETALNQLAQLWPNFAQEKIKIYSIAFTEASDVKFLEEVAQKTGGFFKFAQKDKDVHVIFASLFEKIKSPDTVPITENGFMIDSTVQEAVVLITKEAGTSTELLDPSQKTHSPQKHAPNINWYPASVFDMITLQQPAAGNWKVRLSSKEGNKVFILTNLRLHLSAVKNFVEKGSKIPVEVSLEKDGGVIKEKDILEQVSFSAEISGPDGKNTKIILNDQGTSGDNQAGDGVFYGEFLAEQAGEYNLKILVESKTFKREKNLQFKATEPQAPPRAQNPAEEKKADPPPPPPATPKKEEGSLNSLIWMFVLFNLVILLLAEVAYFSWKFIRKRKKKAD